MIPTSTLLLTAPLGGESATPAQRPEPATETNTDGEFSAAVPQLQIGDFVLGDLDCPSLTGHPDIRY